MGLEAEAVRQRMDSIRIGKAVRQMYCFLFFVAEIKGRSREY